MSSSAAENKAGVRKSGSNERIRMVLFVAGDEKNSQAARDNLRQICSEYLPGCADIEIVDVLIDHRKAIESRILLTPALLVFNAGRSARVTGTLQDSHRVLSAIGMTPSGAVA